MSSHWCLCTKAGLSASEYECAPAGSLQKWPEAVHWFEHMLKAGLMPEEDSTFMTAINAYASLGKSAEVLHWVAEMERIDLCPDGATYKAVVRALCDPDQNKPREVRSARRNEMVAPAYDSPLI
eukprot:SAG11_NODE_2121_length_3790_cov_3.824709_3_plen_124_part_00